MASPFTDPGANIALDATFTNTPALYLCLFTGDPGQSGGFTNEVSGNGYARIPATWAAAAARAKSNAGQHSFPPATGAWGTITYWGVATAITAGTLIEAKTLTAPVAVVTDDMPIFANGALTVNVPA